MRRTRIQAQTGSRPAEHLFLKAKTLLGKRRQDRGGSVMASSVRSPARAVSIPTVKSAFWNDSISLCRNVLPAPEHRRCGIYVVTHPERGKPRPGAALARTFHKASDTARADYAAPLGLSNVGQAYLHLFRAYGAPEVAARVESVVADRRVDRYTDLERTFGHGYSLLPPWRATHLSNSDLADWSISWANTVRP